jgi:hypothetical protein
MIKFLLTFSVAFAFAAAAASADLYTYSDADYAGTLNGSGNPSGIQLVAGGSGASFSSTFDFVNADATSTFTIGTPYKSYFWDTYVSQLGFRVGIDLVVPETACITLFFRDPNNSTETFTFTAADLLMPQGNVNTAFVLSNGATASIDSIINASGSLSYSITATSGDLYFDAAFMEIVATPDGGSTVCLLGLALMSIGAWRHRAQVS